MQINLPADINKLRDRYLSEVDKFTGIVRAKYRTDISGQDSTYLTKFSQAQEFLNSPVLGKSYPYLIEEATSFSKSTEEVAQNIINKALLWEQLGAKIEALRLKAKSDLRSATSIKELYIIKQQFTEDLANLTS